MTPQSVIAAQIAQNGFAVFPVMGGPRGEPPFAYTIGLTESAGLPELIVIGPDPRSCGAILFMALRHLYEMDHDSAAPGRAADGTVLADIDDAGLTVALKDAKQERAAMFACQAIQRYEGSPYKPCFQQLVLQDEQGRFPWEVGCRESVADEQSLLWNDALPAHAMH